ncbi:hypothetical protein [Echinimonas agarilytica]|uniref:Uncharacterized protein n=1 Tax=Echinimonas agarilytica TaxID=1215918 RepID=A0AA42B6T2_9GAMM|nr:hypothetical protein [Echinimonas agarilytica]MCM2678683.1 hypothetical protein [Echinimonas agarilytica]
MIKTKTEFVFVLILVAMWAACIYTESSMVVPAIVTVGFWVVRIRKSNIEKVRLSKMRQTEENALALGASEDFIAQWLKKPMWTSQDNYNDVHPGREAEAIYDAYQEQQAECAEEKS